jgi:acyl-CoA synthetase (AMP-forming)/AMP-acid ligase II
MHQGSCRREAYDSWFDSSSAASRPLHRRSHSSLVFTRSTQYVPTLYTVGSCTDFAKLCYPALFLGIIGAGGQFTGSNPAYTAGELAHHLKISKSDFLFTQSASLEVAVQASNEAGIPPHRVFLFDEPQDLYDPTYQSWRVLLQYGEADWRRFDDVHTSATTTAILASTSGTTGLPKMAARSHRSFVAEHHAMIQEARKSYKVCCSTSCQSLHAYNVSRS